MVAPTTSFGERISLVKTRTIPITPLVHSRSAWDGRLNVTAGSRRFGSTTTGLRAMMTKVPETDTTICSRWHTSFMDLFGRRNIESPNLLFTMQPHEKLKLLLWYHYFRLQNGNDTPYSVVMTPFNPGVASTSSDLGHEIDLTATYQLNPRTQILIGYSHFFAGRYYNNPALPTNADADFFYTQFHVNF